jgi:hypothetical protein
MIGTAAFDRVKIATGLIWVICFLGFQQVIHKRKWQAFLQDLLLGARLLVSRADLYFHNSLQAKIMNKCCVLPLPIIKCTDLFRFDWE